jgi:hypothetical protein
MHACMHVRMCACMYSIYVTTDNFRMNCQDVYEICNQLQAVRGRPGAIFLRTTKNPIRGRVNIWGETRLYSEVRK